MQGKTKNQVADLQMIISKMPIQVCCVMVLPEFGIRWRELSRAVRNARLPMTSSSVAKVLCRHVAKSITPEEIGHVVAKLRLKLLATQHRTWHVIKLMEQISDEPVNVMTRMLPTRIEQALLSAKTKRDMRPEVQSVKLGDLIYISIQMKSEVRESGVLYVAVPVGEPVALVSSVQSNLLRACIKGLGYNKFEDASLNGRDIYSLLQIYNGHYTEHADHLAALPDYNPGPCLIKGGIDYTGRAAAQRYAEEVIGPNPPQLSKLAVTVNKTFYNPDILNKKMKVTIQLKSENVAATLQSWVAKGALHPTSELLQMFHKIKSNKICIDSEPSEAE